MTYLRRLWSAILRWAGVLYLLLLSACAPCITDTQCGGGYAPADTVRVK